MADALTGWFRIVLRKIIAGAMAFGVIVGSL